MTELKIKAKEGIDKDTINSVQSLGEKYKYGFTTKVDMDYAPKGLSEDIIKLISKKNSEPKWMLDWRIEAYRRWIQMSEPDWPMLKYNKIDYGDQYYYATVSYTHLTLPTICSV